MSTATILDAATATGAGSALKVSPFNTTHSYAATITGAPTAVTVVLEGSLDGTTWFTLGTHAFSAGELTATAAYVVVAAMPVESVRANLTVLTGGTTPTVTVKYGQSIA